MADIHGEESLVLIRSLLPKLGVIVPGRQGEPHLLRVGNPTGVLELAGILDGYTGLHQCLAGNAWGLKTSTLAPYIARTEIGAP